MKRQPPTKVFNFRLSPELHARVLALGGADWLRSLVDAALGADLVEGELADALAHWAALRDRRRDVDDPASAAEALLDRATGDAAQARAYLTGTGWSGAEVLAAQQAMMGTLYLHGVPLAVSIAADMHDGGALGAVDLAGWGVSAERWAALVEQVRRDPEVARSLTDVGRLFWAASGSALERALRR